MMNAEMNSLEVLEAKVTQMVEAFSGLQAEKKDLATKLEEREIEIINLREKVDRLAKEREAAKKKVAEILHRMERIINPQIQD